MNDEDTKGPNQMPTLTKRMSATMGEHPNLTYPSPGVVTDEVVGIGGNKYHSRLPPIIGICGAIGAGKDSLAEAIAQITPINRVSFAHHLKDLTAHAYGWDRKLLEGDTKESRAWREETDTRWDITPRSALQKMGTGMREIDKDFWVKVLMMKINNLDKLSPYPYVITDVRFANEFKAIRDAGGVIVRVTGANAELQPEWWKESQAINRKMAWADREGLTDLERDNTLRAAHDLTQKFQRKYPDVHISEWAWSTQTFDHTVHNPKSTSPSWSRDLQNSANELLSYLARPYV